MSVIETACKYLSGITLKVITSGLLKQNTQILNHYSHTKGFSVFSNDFNDYKNLKFRWL
jgi:hypothetical protein